MKFKLPKLVADWKQCLRWFSVQVPAINTALILTWAQIPQKFQDAYPVKWLLATVIFLLVLGVYGRLVDQSKPSDKAEPTP